MHRIYSKSRSDRNGISQINTGGKLSSGIPHVYSPSSRGGIHHVGFTMPHGEISRIYLVELTAFFSTLVTVPRGGIHHKSQRNSLSGKVNFTARHSENHRKDG